MFSIRDFSRTALSASAFAAALIAGTGAGSAQSYPEKAITIIAPTGPGSLVDLLARLVAEGMREEWGQQVIVENVAGAGGSIGVGQLAGAEADGYTIGFVPANLTTLPYLYDITYDVKADFEPVIQVAGASMVHYVNADLGISTEEEFIAYAKANAGMLTFANAGSGSAANLAARLFEAKTGIEMTAIPYDKLDLGVLDVVAGRVSTIFVSAAQGMQYVTEGKLTALGITGLTANPAAPDLKPIAEQGVPGYEFRSWFGFIVPKGTSADVVAAINAEVIRQSASPAFQETLARAGVEPILGTPEEFAQVIDSELADWATLLTK